MKNRTLIFFVRSVVGIVFVISQIAIAGSGVGPKSVAIVGMGPSGMTALETFANSLEEVGGRDTTGSPRLRVDIFDPDEMAGGQVKTYQHDDGQVSELGAVIVFPSWNRILSLAEKYRVPMKSAPMNFQRLNLGGEELGRLVPLTQYPQFFVELARYRTLLNSPPYRKMFEEGTFSAPEDLLSMTVGEWSKLYGIERVVAVFNGFYSGCGYGQDIRNQPALYFPLLMTWQNVSTLISDSLKVKSFVNGYQSLWTTMAEELQKKQGINFYYRTRVTEVLVPSDPTGLYQVTYESLDAQGEVVSVQSRSYDRVIISSAPRVAAQMIRSEVDAPEVKSIQEVLASARVFNYRVTLVDGNLGKSFSRPVTRFFEPSYKERSQIAGEPVLDIQFNPHDPRYVDHHMLYDYPADAKSAPVQIEEYGGVVNKTVATQFWQDYHPHFEIPELVGGALQRIHDFNQSGGVRIAGAITQMGFTEAAATEGSRAAQVILKEFSREVPRVRTQKPMVMKSLIQGIQESLSWPQSSSSRSQFRN